MKFKDLEKMNISERNEKLKELKIELAKSATGSSKQGSSKHRQIKKIIARIHTLSNKEKLGEKNEK
jgi:ribosomal protein L29